MSPFDHDQDQHQEQRENREGSAPESPRPPQASQPPQSPPPPRAPEPPPAPGAPGPSFPEGFPFSGAGGPTFPEGFPFHEGGAPPPPFSADPPGGPDAGIPGEPGIGGARRYSVGAQGAPRLSITNISGSIQVRGDETVRDTITLRAINEDGQEVALEDVAEVSHTPGGDFTVRVQPLANINRRMRRVREVVNFNRLSLLDNIGELVEAVSGIGKDFASLNFEAVVPRHCNLDLNSASGEMDVEGVEGTLNLRSASGTVSGTRLGGNVVIQTASGEVDVDGLEGVTYLRSISGEIKTARFNGNLVIQTASGDVEVTVGAGQLGFKSVSGDLEVTDCALTGMYLSTTSGDCTIDAVLQPGDFEARTVSGDLELRVQPDLSATLTGRTVSGSFRSDLPYRAHWERDEPGASDIDIDIDIDLGEKHWERRLHREKERRERRERQERRRARSRWEFVVGDPALAEQTRTRLRVRTVSGDLSIKRRRGGAAGPVGVPTGRRAAAARDSARPAAARHEGRVNLAQMVEGEGTMSNSDQESRATAQGAPPQPASAPGRARGEGNWPDAELWPSREERERSRLEILQAVERKELSVEEAMLLMRELDDEAR